MPKLCLNMIVRNESARIERCLASVAPWINAYVITDTGSTDGTPEIIKKFFAERRIVGQINHIPFKNFAQARNAALIAARVSRLKCDYLLLCDADMELVVEANCQDTWRDWLTAPAYDVIQKAGGLSYANTRLVRSNNPGLYVGVTHEYLDCGGSQLLSGVFFVDHADGANRKDKFARDIALLEEALRSEPNNGRYWFYLAQSFRDAGFHSRAADCYKRRVDLGGWDEEAWNAQLNYAHSLKSLGDEGGFVREAVTAYNMRPSRAESLYDLAQHYRHKGMNAAAVLFAETGMSVPYPKDVLFVSDYAYHTGLREEFSICGFYLPEKRAKAFKVCSDLAVDKRGTSTSRECARANLYYYIEPLSTLAKHVVHHRIPFEAPDGYVAMNPSVVLHDGVLRAIIRTVNYTITESGHYVIRGTDGTANDSNPINTRNFLVAMDRGFMVEDMHEINWSRPEPTYKLVTGLEDMRLFVDPMDSQALAASACIREQNGDGRCEQVLTRLAGGDVLLWKVIRPTERNDEKNWAPFPRDGKFRWVYRLGRLIDDHGGITPAVRCHLDVDHISGGSQVIPFCGNYLSVVHEARVLSNGTRYYHHRFAMLDSDGSLLCLSLPFVFQAKQIEFAAGLCWHPDLCRLVISYGVRDCEAWCTTIDASDVMGMFA